jgi:hypothetical protein
MFDGSLVAHGPWQALVTFQQFIILADKEGVVDMTPTAISGRTSIPIEIIQTGIAALEEPDPDSRSPDEEGRRIVRLSDTRTWGWRIVNIAHYRKIRSQEERREYQRNYARKRRAKKVENVADGLTPVDSVDKSRQSTKSTNSSKQYVVSNKDTTSGSDEPKPRSWVVEGTEWWAKHVGTMTEGHFGKAMSEPVRLHTWARVFPGIKCYVEDARQRGKPAKVSWCADEIVRWVEWAAMPATDETGLLTARGKAIMGAAP